MKKNITTINPKGFISVHSDTLFVHPLFPELDPESIRKDTFEHGPCWAILEPGMTMEKHHHPHPEFYVFTQGQGEMTLGEETFYVKAGMSVNIPCDVEHEVSNKDEAKGPLVWVSVSLK